MFKSLLIANRGEIACRIATTARRLGIRTVAVYSEADADAHHVALCDEAVAIGGPAPRDSYLRGEAIVQAALATGAEAVHPGYGFLSENAGFAQACADAGLIFVGPPPGAIAAMGSKAAAKALMAEAGVPLVPGYHGNDQDAGLLAAEADRIGYPVLIKASAGGGGKGMRVVESAEAFAQALASCQREATASFGDARMLVERYLQKPRHIEIQVFADTHGQCVYLFERDCSVQRRHQKVLEEAPAPGMTPERRQAMGDAAVAAARAVGYVGAGTVEFIAEPDGRFYFMEMNTRLQVEHPVTEMIVGHDLVEWQLRVAAGLPLPARQDELHIHGHAIEARVYAENPDTGFLPSIGKLRYLELPPHAAFEAGAGHTPPAVRVDGGVRTGDTITPFYDPMIAKLIVWGADRAQALARLRGALARTRVVGVHTNVAFLARLADDVAFAGADLDTGLIERQRATLLPAAGLVPDTVLALATAALLATDTATATPADPWAIRDGWRVAGRAARVFALDTAEASSTVRIAYAEDGATFDTGHGPVAFHWQAVAAEGTRAATGHQPAARTLRVQVGAQHITGDVVCDGTLVSVFIGAQSWTLHWQPSLALAQSGAADAGGRLTAPMPGRIVSVAVRVGDTVTRGQALLVMEAMKMEHTITAPDAGVVQEISYTPGDQVAEGARLIALQA